MELDLLLMNGTIRSLDKENHTYKRMGMKDKKIVLLDDKDGSEDIQAKKVLDLQGKLVLPGFHDTHIHVLEYAEQKNAVDLIGTTSVSEIISRSKEHLEREGLYQGWLIGNGWNQNKFTDGNDFIYKKDLDEISTDFPIILVRTCVHLAVVNSKALQLILESEQSSNIRHYIDEENGILKENAVTLYRKILEKHNVESIKKMILSAHEDLIKEGITSVHSADLFFAVPEEDWSKLMLAYEELDKEKKLKVRTYEQCMFLQYENFANFLERGYQTGQGNEYFKIGPLKIVTDGSLGARTAYMSEDYADKAGERGILILDEQKLRRFMEKAKQHKMQLAVHTIGDGSAELVVRLLNEYNKEDLSNPMRDGIVHAQITTKEILDEMKRGNITAYVQPVFVDTDMDIAEERVGYEKASTSYAWKSMIDRGLLISGGSDAPVVRFDVLENIYFAVTRKNMAGSPEHGWFPQEKLSVQEAVELFTINGAYHSHEEQLKGSLEIGKLADAVVLNENIYEIEEDHIKDVSVDYTIFDGEIIFERGEK